MSWLECIANDDEYAQFHSESEIQNIAKAALELLGEQESDTDCISRQAAIDAIYELFPEIRTREQAQDIFSDLPSVQPERKKGRWKVSINDPERTYGICSECGLDTTFWSNTPEFCSRCGADMRGEQDD